jgi:FkbM family methyltransferase
MLDFISRKVHRYIDHLAGFWNLWSIPEQHRTQSAALARLTEALSRLEALDSDLASNVGTLSLQIDETKRKMQTLYSDVSRVVAAEIERLDGYLVYHADTFSRQLDEANKMRQLDEADKVLYVNANLDALFVAAHFDFLIPTAEVGLLSYIVRHGVEALEPGVRAVLQARLRTGDTAVDIGANIGLHALTMARIVGSSGRVVCFEPLPDIAATLERTLRLNGFDKWTQVICSAVADSAGEATLHRAPHSPMSSLFPISEGSDSITVRTISLDDHFAPGERVDIVKIDAEGAEPLVYKGMSRIIRENPGIELILEWSASHFVRSKQSPDSFWELIQRDGFRPQLIDDQEPGRLVVLQEAGRIPAVANILLTRKRTGA